MRLLLADADPTRSLVIGAAPGARGWDVERVGAAEQILRPAREHGHDVVPIARKVRGTPASEAIGLLREVGLLTPVVVLCTPEAAAELGRNGVSPMVTVFRAGADDAVPEGIDPDELAARCAAVARRDRTRARRQTLALGPVTLDRDAREAHAHGRLVRLSSQEFEVFDLLVRRRGTVVSRTVIMDHLYGGIDEPGVGAKVVDVIVCKLRRMLADAGAGGLIGTAWGHGYIACEPGKGPGPQSHRGIDADERRLIAEAVGIGGRSIHAVALHHGLAWRTVEGIVADAMRPPSTGR